MARTYRYVQVDVFTTTALEGNPLAVFPAADGLESATMQRIARELNLSETTFVFPAESDAHTAQVRIFTPTTELAFAGHPTLGTAFVLRDERGGDALILEENVGPVPVRVEHGADGALRFWLKTPPIAFGERVSPAAVARALDLEPSDLHSVALPETAGAGTAFLFVALREREAVDRAVFTPRLLRTAAPNLTATGVFIFAPRELDDPKTVYARMFAPDVGVVEDPATGSATGPLAAYMIRYGLVPRQDGLRLLSEQGTKMGRRSLLHVLVHVDSAADPRIEVGGSVVPIARGEMTVP